MTSICIPIRSSEDEDGTVILFPLPAAGQDLTLDDLRSAFPSLTSIRYKDAGENLIYHVLCRNGVLQEPDGGWKKEGRLYIAMNEGARTQSRFGIFEQYRRKIRSTEYNKDKDNRPQTSSTSKSRISSCTNVKVGHGHFKDGVFSRISSTNLSGVGGSVVVGPFTKEGNTAEEIRDTAFDKLCCINNGFKKRFKNKKDFYLLYPDGKRVISLPDNSAEFSLQGYRDFIDPHKRYDRLRFFLCEKSNFDLHNMVEIVSNSSSSEDELPSLTRPLAKNQLERNETMLDDEDDDTLPLVINVLFHHGEKTYEQSYANNSMASALFTFICEKLEADAVKLRIGDTYISSDDKLMELTPTSKLDVYAEVNERSDGTDGRKLIVPGSYCECVDVTPLVNKILSELGSTEEPTAVLKAIQNTFVTGRKLDCIMDNQHLEGETNAIFIGRTTIFDDAVREMELASNIRLTLEVTFYGEQSADFGGPRKEFFRLIIKEINERMIDVDQAGKIVLKYNRALIENKGYYVAGLLTGLSAYQNGPCPTYLDGLRRDWSSREEYIMFKKGLERVGLWQMMEAKPSLAYLFREGQRRLTVQKLLTLLKPIFSEMGSSRRQREETVYSHFVRYIRFVAAGRITNVCLQKILSFTTGSEEEPVLGFNMPPSVTFNTLMGNLPTASTCTNTLTLPLDLDTADEETVFEKFSLSFTNEYFGFY